MRRAALDARGQHLAIVHEPNGVAAAATTSIAAAAAAIAARLVQLECDERAERWPRAVSGIECCKKVENRADVVPGWVVDGWPRGGGVGDSGPALARDRAPSFTRTRVEFSYRAQRAALSTEMGCWSGGAAWVAASGGALTLLSRPESSTNLGVPCARAHTRHVVQCACICICMRCMRQMGMGCLHTHTHVAGTLYWHGLPVRWRRPHPTA